MKNLRNWIFMLFLICFILSQELIFPRIFLKKKKKPERMEFTYDFEQIKDWLWCFYCYSCHNDLCDFLNYAILHMETSLP